jgi:hypothetical protein
MKGRFLAGVAGVVGVLATPALAADVLVYQNTVPEAGSPVYSNESMITGDIALAIGYFDFPGEDGAFGVANARVNIPFGGGWNEELEIAGLADFVDDGYYAVGAFSHTYYKNPGFAAGLLLGVTGLESPNTGDNEAAYTVGVEHAWFLPALTFLGHLSYTWFDPDDFWTVGGEARWYLNPNTKLTGAVTWADLNSSWMLTAAAEHLLSGTNFSFFLSSSYFTNDFNDGWEVLGGIRYAFGPPVESLQRHDWNVPFAAARIISY